MSAKAAAAASLGLVVACAMLAAHQMSATWSGETDSTALSTTRAGYWAVPWKRSLRDVFTDTAEERKVASLSRLIFRKGQMQDLSASAEANPESFDSMLTPTEMAHATEAEASESQFPPQCSGQSFVGVGSGKQCVGSGVSCALCLTGNGQCKATMSSIEVNKIDGVGGLKDYYYISVMGAVGHKLNIVLRATDGYHKSWTSYSQLWTDKIHHPGRQGRSPGAVDHLQVQDLTTGEVAFFQFPCLPGGVEARQEEPFIEVQPPVQEPHVHVQPPEPEVQPPTQEPQVHVQPPATGDVVSISGCPGCTPTSVWGNVVSSNAQVVSANSDKMMAMARLSKEKLAHINKELSSLAALQHQVYLGVTTAINDTTTCTTCHAQTTCGCPTNCCSSPVSPSPASYGPIFYGKPSVMPPAPSPDAGYDEPGYTYDPTVSLWNSRLVYPPNWMLEGAA